jgi:hypothetical protein
MVPLFHVRRRRPHGLPRLARLDTVRRRAVVAIASPDSRGNVLRAALRGRYSRLLLTCGQSPVSGPPWLDPGNCLRGLAGQQAVLRLRSPASHRSGSPSGRLRLGSFARVPLPLVAPRDLPAPGPRPLSGVRLLFSQVSPSRGRPPLGNAARAPGERAERKRLGAKEKPRWRRDPERQRPDDPRNQQRL